MNQPRPKSRDSQGIPVAIGAACVLLSLGLACSGSSVSNGEAVLSIERFESVPESIVPGESATLQWTVKGARKIRVLDSLQNVITEYTVRDAEALGSLSVSPVISTVYTLEISRDGLVKRAETTVRFFGPDVEPRVIFFDATPSAIVAGSLVTLTWSAFDAARITLFANGVQLTYVTDHREIRDGSYVVTPAEDTLYELVAANPNLEVSASTLVSVRDDPVVESFTIDRQEITAGEMVRLAWKTRYASDVNIIRSDGSALLASSGLARAPEGEVRVHVSADETFTLTALGSWAQADASVSVETVPVPVIEHFAPVVEHIMRGESAELAWRVRDSEQTWVTLGAGAILVQPAPLEGSVVVTPLATTEYMLFARNRLGYEVDGRALVRVGDTVAFDATASPSAVLSSSMFFDFYSTSTLTWSAPGADSMALDPVVDYDLRPMASANISSSGSNVGVSPLTPAAVRSLPFPFTFDGQSHSELMISYWGFASFDIIGGGVNAYRCDASDAAPNGFMAPFWNREFDRGGRVLVQTRGVAPARQFVVQWDQMLGFFSDSLTFQLVLNEDGSAEYHYLTTQAFWYAGDRGVVGGENLAGTKNAIVSCMSDGAGDYWRAGGDPVYFPPSAFSFGESLPTSGTRHLLITESLDLEFTANFAGIAVTKQVPITVLQEGELQITEIMYDPEGGVADESGEWFEVTNFGEHRVELQGWALGKIDVSLLPLIMVIPAHVIDRSLVIQPGGRVVFGVHANPALNGGVAVDYVYPRTPELAFDNTADEMNLLPAGPIVWWQPMFGASYDETTGLVPEAAGASLAFPKGCNGSRLFGNCCDSSQDACVATTPMGDGANLGTPGQVDDLCVIGDSCAKPFEVDLSAGSVTFEHSVRTMTNMLDAPQCSRTGAYRERVYRVDIPAAALMGLIVESPYDVQVHRWRGGCGAQDFIGCDFVSTSADLPDLREVVEPGTYFFGVEPTTTSCAMFDVTVWTEALHYTTSVTGTPFEDISGSGAALGAVDDEAYNSINLGFDMPYIESTVSSVGIGTNGFIATSLDAALEHQNRALAIGAAPHGVIAPFWDDLVPDLGVSGLHYETRGLPGNERFIVQWSGWDIYNNDQAAHRDGTTVTFQVVLFESGSIEFRYERLDAGLTEGRAAGSGATVGVESVDGRWGYPYSVDEPSLAVGATILFTPR